MSAVKRTQANKGKEFRSFVGIPHECANHSNFKRLSAHAVKLLLDIAVQYRGNNNGDLTIAFSLMKLREWKSEETLNKAKRELLHYGWIVLTRQGGKNLPSLYAVTWNPINECKGKLDVKETRKSLGHWKEVKQKFRPVKRRSNRQDKFNASLSVIEGGKPC